MMAVMVVGDGREYVGEGKVEGVEVGMGLGGGSRALSKPRVWQVRNWEKPGGNLRASWSR